MPPKPRKGKRLQAGTYAPRQPEPEPEPMPQQEAGEGVPLVHKTLETELNALKLRPLIRRAEQMGVDNEKLDSAKDTHTIIKFIVEKVKAECGSLEASAPRVLKPSSRDGGHALPKLMQVMLAKLVLVSAPEFGPGPGADEFKTPVMSGLERLAGYIFPNCITAYDFAGSASAQDCKAQIPDSDLSKHLGAIDEQHGWTDSSIIEQTQWFRYWSGRVRSALSAVLLTSQPIEGNVNINCGDGGGVVVAHGQRTVFAVSISGGPITQTEKKALPGLIDGTISDLLTRDLNIGGVKIGWLHFETLEDFLKALQGFGGVDFGGAMAIRSDFDLPGEWVDGAYQEDYDLLKDVPGESPDERRAFLLKAVHPNQEQLDMRLLNAIGSVERVRELLGLDENNIHLPEGKRPLLCANPDYYDPTLGSTRVHEAAASFDVASLKSLLAAGADPHLVDSNGLCPLSMAVNLAEKAPKEEIGVAERVASTIEVCAQAQLGVTYTQHIAMLVVGATITWTYHHPELPKEYVGTIVDFNDTDGRRLVRGLSGKNVWFEEFQQANARLAHEALPPELELEPEPKQQHEDTLHGRENERYQSTQALDGSDGLGGADVCRRDPE